MNAAIIEIAGYELDVKGKFGFGLNYSIDDVHKPEKRNTNYSKTITLAGTKIVNKAMGGLFDVNAEFTFFNPNFKTPAKIIINSSTVIDGYLQLKAIEKSTTTAQDGSNIEYKCVILSKATEFFGDIKDKELEELDFSTHSHVYSQANIAASWTHTPVDVYTYPLMYKNSNSYDTKDFKPSIFHKAYLKRIAQEAGYILSGTILDESTDEGAAYAKEIIPFNGDLPVLPEAEYTRRLFQVGMTAAQVAISSGEVIGGADNGNWNGQHQTAASQLTGFTDETTNGNFDPNGHWNTSLDEYTVDSNGNFDLDFKIAVKSTHTTKSDITSIVQSGSNILVTLANNHGLKTTGSNTLTIQGTVNYDGVYNATYISDTSVKCTGISYVSDEFVGNIGIDAYESTYVWNWFQGQAGSRTLNQPYEYNVRFQLKRNGVNLGGISNAVMQIPMGTGSGSTFNSVNDWTVSKYGTCTVSLPNISLLENDVITIEKRVYDITNSTTYPMYAADALDSGIAVGSRFTLETEKISQGLVNSVFKNTTNSSLITDGDDISINQYIPKNLKQIDLFTDIIKRYNAYISVDEDNDRKIIIDTRDSYYAKGGTLDWTQKRDYDSKEKISLLSELQNKEIVFTYKEGDDNHNKNYSKSVDGDIYGQKTIEFDNEFVKGVKKIETPFSPTPLVYNSGSPVAIIPAISAIAPQSNMRVLHFSGLINCINSGSWSFNWINAGTPTVTTYTTYPYAGHYDDPIAPSLDINFGEIPYAWYAEATNTTNGSLYNRFWSNYVNQIDNGKLVTLKMNLNEVDISFIKNNLNTKIFIKDAWYYINKIKDYNPIVKKLTTVEFLKIDDGISFVFDTPPLTQVSTENNALLRTSGDEGGSNSSGSEDTLITGNDNRIGVGSEGSIIIGDNNFIGDNSPNTIIQGNNVTVDNDLPNSYVIGSNDKTISNENEGYIGGNRLINGVAPSLTESIDLADLYTLRDNSELVTGNTYFAQDEGLFLTAASESVISNIGSRIMRVLLPSVYTTYDLHNEVDSYSINDIRRWGGRVWIALTAGTSVPDDYKTLPSADWELLTSDTYYIDKIFKIKYSEELAAVTEQSDENGNIVVYNDVDDVTAYTLGDGFLYSDWSDERIVNNTCSIFVNNEVGEISGNISRGIVGNILAGSITNNTNKGDIIFNTENAGSELNIFDNANNGSIKRNNATSIISINENLNNGNIGAASPTNRASSISDTAVNK
ncbi:MAG: hypothetical protein KUG64_10465 [Cycloclasticus sp.]|nr:hypothetical protein [Cycloclasticus sp.]